MARGMTGSAPLPLEEAQARLLALAAPLPLERIEVAGALGHYLALPLIARHTRPAADLSAMDGYALAADDLAGPWQVIGESAAGHPFGGETGPGQAVRIATGALLPSGADCVLLQEDARRDGDTLTLCGKAPVPATRHIRRRAADFREGETLLPAGTRIGPAQIGLAISAGHSHLDVHRRPRLAIIDSGDELCADPDRCAIHQIPASNSAMLAALAATVPCVIERLGPVEDDLDALERVFSRAAQADVIVTSGGASVGEHDLIRPALQALGAEIDFWRVAIKPGKPLLVARLGRQLVIGLPGNPVSSHVTAYLFLLPLLRVLQGAASTLPLRMTARLAAPLVAGVERREFLRASWDGAGVIAQTQQDSGALASLAASNALIDRPANAPAAATGSDVLIHLLENGGIA